MTVSLENNMFFFKKTWQIEKMVYQNMVNKCCKIRNHYKHLIERHVVLKFSPEVRTTSLLYI